MKNSQEIRLMTVFLKLAENPNHNSVRYKWLSVLLMTLGFLLIVASVMGLAQDYEPIEQLVWFGLFGGFFLGYSILFSAASIQRKLLGRVLDKKAITKRLEELEENTEQK